MVKSEIDVQPENAFLPMLITELGMVIEVRPLQFTKAVFPMLVTELGIVNDVSPLQQ